MESLAGRAGDKLQCLYHHVGPVDDGSNICQATQGGGGVARLERLQQLLPLDLLVLRLRARHDVQRVPRGHVGADEAAEKVKRVAANLVVRHDEHVAARCDLVGVAGARLHGDRLAGPLVDGALEHGPFVLLTQPRQQVLRVRLVLQQAPAQRRLAREGDAVGERVGCDVRDVQLGVQVRPLQRQAHVEQVLRGHRRGALSVTKGGMGQLLSSGFYSCQNRIMDYILQRNVTII
mmetsp:Transcript_44733/g.114385  ORF Transcript_44733/g.114385 Transcript_44733/m.114385 type:complete len:234 (+) Transcript_44733:310-1011(+)